MSSKDKEIRTRDIQDGVLFGQLDDEGHFLHGVVATCMSYLGGDSSLYTLMFVDVSEVYQPSKVKILQGQHKPRVIANWLVRHKYINMSRKEITLPPAMLC